MSLFNPSIALHGTVEGSRTMWPKRPSSLDEEWKAPSWRKRPSSLCLLAWMRLPTCNSHVLFWIETLVTWSCQRTPWIFIWDFMWKACRRARFCFVVVQVSEAYSRTGRTRVEYRRSLVDSVRWHWYQTWWRRCMVPEAIPILLGCSVRDPFSELIWLPGYTKSCTPCTVWFPTIIPLPGGRTNVLLLGLCPWDMKTQSRHKLQFQTTH